MRRYRDNQTKPKCEMEQRKMMDKIQSLSFALQETALFLDGHPQNRMALAYYSKIKAELDCLTKEYEAKFAPITFMSQGGNECNGWRWVTEPWPWEMNFPEGGDHPHQNPVACQQRGKED